MNKYQEALDVIKSIDHVDDNGIEQDTVGYWYENEIKTLQELVDKTIPRELDYEGDGYWDGKPVLDTAICRKCGKRFEVDYDEHSNFCPNCGQALDWSADDD